MGGGTANENGGAGGDGSTRIGDASSDGSSGAASNGGTSVPSDIADSSADGASNVPRDASGAICARCDGACIETLPVDGAQHVEGDIDYPTEPPAGGDHNECWAPWGAHDSPVRAENWVHNLEHGGVVVLYDCPDGCPDEVRALETFTTERERVLLSPYPDMGPGFAIVAWGRRLVSSCLDLDAMKAFYDEYFDQAPESVIAGPPRSCLDGGA